MKLSPKFDELSNDPTSVVMIRAEGRYKRAEFDDVEETKVKKLRSGLVIRIPWDDSIKSLTLFVFSLPSTEDSPSLPPKLTAVVVGGVLLDNKDIKLKQQLQLGQDTTIELFHVRKNNGGPPERVRMGKISCRLKLHRGEVDDQNVLKYRGESRGLPSDDGGNDAPFFIPKVSSASNAGKAADDLQIHRPPDNFRFQRLARRLNWERLRSLNLEKIVHENDVATLFSCIDDVASGDISQQDVDSEFYPAVQISQYITQYLLGCRKLLSDREVTISAALKEFDEEEEHLDIQLAKMRAREKALRREKKSIDDIHSQYLDLLYSLDAKLGEGYLNTLKAKEKNEYKIQYETGKEGRPNRDIHAMTGLENESREKGKKNETESSMWTARLENNNKSSTKISVENSTANVMDNGNVSPSSHAQPYTSSSTSSSSTSDVNPSSPKSSSSGLSVPPTNIISNIPEANTWKSASSASENRNKSSVMPLAKSNMNNASNNSTSKWENAAAPPTMSDASLRDKWPASTSSPGSLRKHPSSSGLIDDLMIRSHPSSTSLVDDLALKRHTSSSSLLDDSNQDIPVSTLGAKPPIFNGGTGTLGTTVRSSINVRSSVGASSVGMISVDSLNLSSTHKVSDNEVVDFIPFDEESLSMDLKQDFTAKTAETSVQRSINDYPRSKGSNIENDKDLREERDVERVKVRESAINYTTQGRKDENPHIDELEDIEDFSFDDSKTEQKVSAYSKDHTAPIGKDKDSIDSKTATTKSLTSNPHDTENIQKTISSSSGWNRGALASGQEKDDNRDKAFEGMRYHGNSDIRARNIPGDTGLSSIQPHGINVSHDSTQQYRGVVDTKKDDDTSFGSSYEFDDALAMSDAANALVASYDPTISSSYAKRGGNNINDAVSDGEEVRNLGMRTGVLQYLHKNHDITSADGSFKNSTGNKFGSTLGRDDRGDDDDDVLFGTAVLTPGKVGDSYSDSESSMRSKVNKTFSPSKQDVDDNFDLSTSKEEDFDKAILKSLNKPILPEESSTSAPSKTQIWKEGRAPLELVETGHALDVYVSAIRLEPSSVPSSSSVKLQVEFLGGPSSPSQAIMIGSRPSVQRVDYASHIIFNRSLLVLLAKQLSAQGDNFSLLINVIDSNTNKLLGSATVLLYVMIEDSCSILRQEVDIIAATDLSGSSMGVAVIDVRGHHVLQNT